MSPQCRTAWEPYWFAFYTGHWCHCATADSGHGTATAAAELDAAAAKSAEPAEYEPQLLQPGDAQPFVLLGGAAAPHTLWMLVRSVYPCRVPAAASSY